MIWEHEQTASCNISSSSASLNQKRRQYSLLRLLTGQMSYEQSVWSESCLE